MLIMIFGAQQYFSNRPGPKPVNIFQNTLFYFLLQAYWSVKALTSLLCWANLIPWGQKQYCDKFIAVMFLVFQVLFDLKKIVIRFDVKKGTDSQ